MIQRLQTVFLALAAIMMGLLFSNPMDFVSIDKPLPVGNSESMLADGVFNTQDHVILLVLVVLGILIPAITIFLFKNRPLQMKLSRLAIALVSLALVLTIILFYMDYQGIPVGTEITIDYGYLMPVLAIIFLALALRFIKKDEKLVRSADRLR
ncbi:MAG: DUF4293 domain-containing protein [Saprospiraceae bacterium]|nr:DUF4293 domain-containing protein [Saprospiraceae bacterium]